MTAKNIIIIGGSYGGLSTTHYLLKHVIPSLSRQETYQIVLVSASSQTMCRPACPRAMIAEDMFHQEKLFVNIAQLFNHYPKDRFRFIYGTVTRLDHVNRTVRITLAGVVTAMETITVDFHALVIATGASTASPLFGFNRDETFLKHQWALFREALPDAKSIVIAGGGPTGTETAGELGEYLNGRPSWFGSPLANKPKVSITLVAASPQILPAMHPATARRAEKFLAAVGVSVIKNARVKSVTPSLTDVSTVETTTKATIALDNGTTLHADLYIPTTGTTPNTAFIDEELLSDDGRVETDLKFRVTKAGSRVYAVGDVASNIKRPGIHTILNTTPIVCNNIHHDLLLAINKEEGVYNIRDRTFSEDMRLTQMVPIGKSKGVGEMMGYQLPSLLVWLVKGRDYWLWTTGSIWSGKHWAKKS